MKLRGFKLALSIAHRTSPTNQGFTLFEVLIAVGILGILAAIALPSFSNVVAQTKVNLLAEQVRQSLKKAQWQAIAEGYSYSVAFRNTPQGLQVAYYPVGSEPNPLGLDPNNISLAPPDHPYTWQNLSSSIPSEQLIFVIPDSPDKTITFTPEGDAQYPSMVFLAIGNADQPRVNTRRCINIINNDSGGSYFQIDKDLACNLSPNPSPFIHVVE